MELSEQELVRREKLNRLIELGIDPYPAALFPVKDYSTEIHNNFSDGKSVTVAGRLMSRRIQGNASFAELQDSKGKIQLYFNNEQIKTQKPEYWPRHKKYNQIEETKILKKLNLEKETKAFKRIF